MELFQNSTELMRIVFLIGAVLALVWKKRFGITPGGIIVPGMLALILDKSIILFAAIFVIAIVVYGVYKLIFSSYALTQRWTALVMLSMSAALSLGFISITQKLRLLGQETILLSAVAPGLIALGARKYKLLPAIHATMLVTAITYCAGWLIAESVPYYTLTELTVHLARYKELGLDHPFIALPVSMASAIATYYFFKVRSGGYMIAPFLAVVIANSPIQALLLTIGVAGSYGLVRLMQKLTLIIGLERFVLSLFSAYFVITAIDLLASHVYIPGYRTTPIVLMTAVAVITNDLCLQPIKATLRKGITPALLASVVTKMGVH